MLHYDWLLNDFETFCRHKSLEKAILESADLLEKGEYGPVEDSHLIMNHIIAHWFQNKLKNI